MVSANAAAGDTSSFLSFADATRWVVPGGAPWSLAVPRSRVIRLTCLAPRANVAMLLYADGERSERLNVPDTLKAQMSARIKPGMVLMSDMGRALASVTGSSLDWHDAITGHGVDAHLARYGPSSYAADRNAWRRSARDGLLQELAKHDLSARDLHATVNWFSKVAPIGDDKGTLAFHADHAGAGDWVELRTELDVLVVLSTSPHPLDPEPTWQPAGVEIAISETPPAGDDDACRVSRAEAGRALALSERGLA
ncbi:MAG TPA: urea amidolyase associated protein UAAP1 [Mycobacteriales bacterium]|nr:urea amidolyase associated protein UAAP1 [Mycobacteriales bacterium]